MSAARPAPSPLVPAGIDATLVLLRHGESVYITEGRFQGQADTPLSPLGERQAALAARRLAWPSRSPALPIPTGSPLEIVHSPLMRTSRTAELVAAAMGAAMDDGMDGATAAGMDEATAPRPAPALRPEPGLLEIAQGEWEGLTRAEIEAHHAPLLAAWRSRPLAANAPGGERVLDVQRRVESALRTILVRLAAVPPVPRSETTAMGYPPSAALDTPWSLLVGHDGVFKVALLTILGLPLERFWAFPFAMCGITIVEIRGGMPVLRAHNLTEHLAPLLEQGEVGETDERRRAGAL